MPSDTGKKSTKPSKVPSSDSSSTSKRNQSGSGHNHGSTVKEILRFTAVLVIGALLLSRMLTESWTFGYDGKWIRLKTYLPGKAQRRFSEQELLKYNGEDPKLPIYLAIDGLIYDVSSNLRTYGKGGSYNHFTGRDCARAFVTGCFKTHQTHDTRGFGEKEFKSLDHWKNFFRDHKDYEKIGWVYHPPIDPESPIPEPCKPPKSPAADSGRWFNFSVVSLAKHVCTCLDDSMKVRLSLFFSVVRTFDLAIQC